MLIAAAKLILSSARDTDCVARYGGEEFVIVLPGLAGAGAETVCNRLLQTLRTSPHKLGGAMVKVTASLGLATHSAGTAFASAAALIEAADRAVYAAKRAGRDQLVRHAGGRAADHMAADERRTASN